MCSSRNGYAKAYSKLLRPRLANVRVVVELGVFQGASLATWCDLFSTARVIGLDVQFERFEKNRGALMSRGAFSRNQPRLVTFDAFVTETRLLAEDLGAQGVDVFVDDGPHHIDAILRTAQCIVPLMAPGGVYVVEDLPSALPTLQGTFPDRSFYSDGRLIWGEF